jgi:TRAP-type C4-dicarboxylate transport system substrate-binding protein
MMRYLVRLAALATAMAPTLAGANPIQLKFAFFTSDTEETWITAIRPFIAAVNGEAKGVVEIKPYVNGALGKSLTQQAQLVADGAADMAFVVPGLTPQRFTDNAVMELPGVFRDLRESTLVYGRLIDAAAMNGYENYFVIGALGGVPSSIHSRTPIATLDDLKSRKIRTTNTIEGKALQALSATGFQLATGEAAEALARGAIDGVVMQPVPLVDSGIAKLASYHYFAALGVAPIAVLMNRAAFEGLPPPAQDAIRKYSGAWFGERYVNGMGGFTDKVLKDWQADPKQRLVYPSAEEGQRLQAAYKAVIDSWVAESPRHAELYQALQDQIAKVRLVPVGG